MKRKARALTRATAAVVLTTIVACPIQRAPVPPEYMGFRARVQDAVRDTALVEMEGLPRMQSQLESRLTDLSAILTVDSLLAALGADRELAPLGGAVATTLRIQLEARSVDGGVRKAYRNPDGQRQAVDAIVIGLGRALYRVRSSSNRTDGPRLLGLSGPRSTVPSVRRPLLPLVLGHNRVADLLRPSHGAPASSGDSRTIPQRVLGERHLAATAHTKCPRTYKYL